MERAGDVWFVMRMVCLDGVDNLRPAAKIHVEKRRFWQNSHAIRRLSQAREMREWQMSVPIRGGSGFSSSLHPHGGIIWPLFEWLARSDTAANDAWADADDFRHRRHFWHLYQGFWQF